jgi:hypothetical protein
MSYREVFGVVSDVIGKKIAVKKRGFEEVMKTASMLLFGREWKADGKMLDGWEKKFIYCNRHALLGNPNVLKRLIRRKPMGIKEWAEGKRDAAKAQ